MPRENSNITVDSKVSVTPRFLQNTCFFDSVVGVDRNAPRVRFYGKVIDLFTVNNINKCKVIFDLLPDVPLELNLSGVKYHGPRQQRQQQQQTQQQQQSSGGQPQDDATEDPDLLNDAIQESSADVDEEEILDLNWVDTTITVDSRLADSSTSFRRINPVLHMDGADNASPARYFLHFLPCEHIQNVVIPAINEHASKHISTWINLTWIEYLTWIMMMVYMTFIDCMDKRTYWHMGIAPNLLTLNFNDFMPMKRFEDIATWHVFVVPDGAL